ncbi:MAG TPA: HAD-IIIC family phosphatase [Terriglobia bacterium]|nr:HAD-IIIC family phosphatase [Terriglobia bacterium]
MRNQRKAVLISDFTLNNFAGYLRNDEAFPHIEPSLTPFGQPFQVLMDETLDAWQSQPDMGIVWTRPEAVVGSFNSVIRFEPFSEDDLLGEVDTFCDAARMAAKRVEWLFIPTWALSPGRRGIGVLDRRSPSGVSHALSRMNQRLIQNLEETRNCVVLDAERWLTASGNDAFNPRLWYMAKIPFANPVFKQAVHDVKAALRNLSGQSKKIVILDLDDTLWGGTVGDVGWQNVVLGGHDPAGEALVDFQRELKALKNRGILLAVVSKNDERVALDAIRNHPEMAIREQDLAGWRINWQDKANNIVELMNELNLGLDSAVFIDDNPRERARVRESLPEVLTPEWPEDKLLYRQALLAMDCFDTATITREDRDRAGMYAAERQRSVLQSEVRSVDDWLKSLGTSVVAEPLGDHNLERVTQLLNKTNQMNLSTRRLSGPELLNWTSASGRSLFAFRVSDRFGDSGLTGIASVSIQGETARIVDFILSCRVMGRNVEAAMLAFVLDHARTCGARKAFLQYLQTERNKPAFDFLTNSQLAQDHDGVFTWNLETPYPAPPHVVLRHGEALSSI